MIQHTRPHVERSGSRRRAAARRSLAGVVVVAAMALLGAGCGCSAAPGPQGPPSAFKLFNQLRSKYCSDDYPLPDPVRATPGPSTNEVTMALDSGDLLILNTKRKVVYPVGGPTKALYPLSYSFGCDPNVFQGAAHD